MTASPPRTGASRTAGDYESAEPAAGESPGLAADRVSDLAARMKAVIGRPVDALQVAAALEADGIVDRVAPTRYGRRDLFDLAAEVYAQLDSRVDAPAERPRSRVHRSATLRDISHGLLYLLPAALLPALPSLLGVHQLVLALVTASALGWVWSAATACLAYQLLGRGLHRSVGRVLRVAALSGTAAGSIAGGAIAALSGGGARPVGVTAGLLAFQLALTIAVVYRRELWLFVSMGPGVATGIAHALSGQPDARTALGIGAGSIALTLALALWQTTREPVPDPDWFSPLPTELPLRQAIRPELARLGPVSLYAALSAGFLLHVDARYLSGRLGLAVAAAPLVLGMGLVEWRARRFQHQASDLLHRLSDPRRFASAVWGRLLRGLVAVVTTISALAAGLLLVLERTGMLDLAVAMLVLAHVVVGGAYFLAFVLAAQSGYGRLSALLAAALTVDIAAVWLWPGGADPLHEGIALLACALLLDLLIVQSLLGRLGQPWRYSGIAT